MSLKAEPISSIVHRFADLLDDERSREALDKADPLRVKLVDMLTALGKYAAQVGVDLRQMSLTFPMKAGEFEYDMLAPRKLTDELRRFADVLDKRKDAVLKIDPKLQRLASVVLAMEWYAKQLGVNLGVDGKRGAALRIGAGGRVKR